MKRTLILFVALIAAGALAGCGDDGDTIIGSNGGILNNNDSFPASSIFSNQVWAEGGAYSPTGTPAFDIPGNGGATPVGVPVSSSIPSLGQAVPYGFDEIKFVGFAKHSLDVSQIGAIMAGINNGVPTALDDLVVLPSVATGMPENEDYRFFQINTMESILPPPPPPAAMRGTGRTQVVGIAFRNGTGGYVPVAPATDDTFAGALVWMKATKSALYDTWTMDQRDWRSGSGQQYATSLRLTVRGNSAVAVIRKTELDAIGATEFRWDTFSYTTNVETDWSHDFTNWIAIP